MPVKLKTDEFEKTFLRLLEFDPQDREAIYGPVPMMYVELLNRHVTRGRDGRREWFLRYRLNLPIEAFIFSVRIVDGVPSFEYAEPSGSERPFYDLQKEWERALVV